MKSYFVLKFVILYSILCFSTGIFLPVRAQDTPQISVGGALRFNYNLSSWKPEQKERGGDFGMDMFRINTTAAFIGITLNAEYRLYPESFGGGMLKQGWLGYKLNEHDEIQLGLTQVPFGIQQYNSHNWFFNLSYYVGLEDDHDMGIKYLHIGEIFEYQLAFFKNAEEFRFGNTSEISHSRYSYDVAGMNKEVNKLNAKLIYKFGDSWRNRLGVSGQYGGLYNLRTKKAGSHFGLGVHYEITGKQWNLKAMAITAEHDPENPPGVSRETISMAAYGAPYEVASDFNLYTLSISRDFPVPWKPLSNLQLYNDFGYLQKHESFFEDSFMNVTGILVTAGKVFTYIDYAAGYNHSWLGGNFINDFGVGNPEAKWEARFNINIEYYF